MLLYLHRLGKLAQDDPHRVAVLAAGTRLTRAQLHDRVQAAAAALLDAGLRPGQVVGLTIADECEHLVASLALLALGTTHITLATHDSPELRAQIASRVGVTRVLTEIGGESAAPARALPGAEGSVLLKTSGTTGGMYVVAFTEQQLAQQSARHAEYAGERLLRLASIEHNNSKRHRLYGVWAGGTNVFRPRGSFDLVDFALAAEVTCLDISRMHASDLATMDQAAALAHVKFRTGGSAIPYEVRREVEEKVGRQLYVRYATTEFGAISMAGPGDHDADESSGRPIAGVQLEVVGADGEVLPQGETGEIRLRADGMATAYLGDEEQTARRFRGGWFYPGDLGRLRADGQLVVQGRMDDMIIMNGLNIFPAEIEKVLQRHPAVATAAAFPIASKVHGQIPVAAVELRPGASATGAELQAYARSLLALRTPRKVVVVAELPRNTQGKIVKRDLVQLMEPKKHD